MQPLRTLLSVPGNRRNIIQKARGPDRRRDLRPVYAEEAPLQEGLGGITARYMFGRSDITNSDGKVQA